MSIMSKDVLDRQTLLDDQNEFSVNSNASINKNKSIIDDNSKELNKSQDRSDTDQS